MLAWLDQLARTSLILEKDRAWLAAVRMASLVMVAGIGDASSTMSSRLIQVYPGVIKGAVLGALVFTCCQVLFGGGGPAAAAAKDLLGGGEVAGDGAFYLPCWRVGAAEAAACAGCAGRPRREATMALVATRSV